MICFNNAPRRAPTVHSKSAMRIDYAPLGSLVSRGPLAAFGVAEVANAEEIVLSPFPFARHKVEFGRHECRDEQRQDVGLNALRVIFFPPYSAQQSFSQVPATVFVAPSAFVFGDTVCAQSASVCHVSYVGEQKCHKVKLRGWFRIEVLGLFKEMGATCSSIIPRSKG